MEGGAQVRLDRPRAARDLTVGRSVKSLKSTKTVKSVEGNGHSRLKGSCVQGGLVGLNSSEAAKPILGRFEGRMPMSGRGLRGCQACP